MDCFWKPRWCVMTLRRPCRFFSSFSFPFFFYLEKKYFRLCNTATASVSRAIRCHAVVMLLTIELRASSRPCLSQNKIIWEQISPPRSAPHCAVLHTLCPFGKEFYFFPPHCDTQNEINTLSKNTQTKRMLLLFFFNDFFISYFFYLKVVFLALTFEKIRQNGREGRGDKVQRENRTGKKHKSYLAVWYVCITLGSK